MCFKLVSIKNEKYISCAWLIDPDELEDDVTTRKPKEPWNGEYYVSFGKGEHRDWEDGLKYGFISAGSGAWYSRTLNQLKPNDRIWVNIPQVGYVGVGIVSDTARKADEATFNIEGKEIKMYDLPLKAGYHRNDTEDDDKMEYVIKVKWEKAVPLSKAVSEVGFFGNQNSVCKPTTAKWNHTVERLKSVWEIK